MIRVCAICQTALKKLCRVQIASVNPIPRHSVRNISEVADMLMTAKLVTIETGAKNAAFH